MSLLFSPPPQLGTPIQITVGNSTTFYGFVDSNFGSLSTTTYDGETINELYWNTSTDNVIIQMDGVVAQSHFTTLTLSSPTLGDVVLQSSAATYTNPGGTQSRWVISVTDANDFNTSVGQLQMAWFA